MADKTTTAAGPRPADLREPLVSHGTRHQVGANRPVELAGDTAWYVLDGILDLFLQQHVAGTYGRRRLLGTVGAGTLAWLGGEPEIPPGWRLLAVGRAGTELISVRGTALRQMIEPAALARHVEDFTASMPDGAGGPAGPAAPGPAAPAAQAPGAEPPASPDARISAARQTFGAAVAQTVRRAAQADEADSERIGSEQDRQHRILDSALADLVEVVDRREPLGRAPGSQLAQLNLALARIGRQLGVDIPAQRGLEEDDRDPVGARVTAAGCRARVVTLHAGWWSQAGTVLLGFIADGDSPVALIPARSRYLLFDPSTGDTVRVDQELAGRLAPQAYAIYRPLPAEAHSAKALLGSVLPRLRQEVWLLVALGTLAGLVTLITPMVTSVVYNQVLPTGNRSLLLAISLLLIGATITWGLVALGGRQGVLDGRLDQGVDPDGAGRAGGIDGHQAQPGQVVHRVACLYLVPGRRPPEAGEERAGGLAGEHGARNPVGIQHGGQGQGRPGQAGGRQPVSQFERQCPGGSDRRGVGAGWSARQAPPAFGDPAAVLAAVDPRVRHEGTGLRQGDRQEAELGGEVECPDPLVRVCVQLG